MQVLHLVLKAGIKTCGSRVLVPQCPLGIQEACHSQVYSRLVDREVGRVIANREATSVDGDYLDIYFVSLPWS